MADEVAYTMTLNDLLSPKLDKAEGHAKKFESALGKLGERAVRVGETLGISFAIVKLEEFFHKGTEMVHELDVAEGQLANTIKNVGERAGMSGDQLVAMAEKLQHEIPYTTAQIVDMENALSRFENMTPEVYQKVLSMSADIATALKRNGTEIATTLGRIMEAPAENGRLLRQMNITLTASQRKYLLVLEHTGQIAKAQTFIFHELATKGYEGAAKAAANSDPYSDITKALYELGMQVGHVGIAIEEAFAPALEDSVEWLKTAGQFIADNKDLIIGLAEGLAGAAIAYGAYLAVLKGVAAYQAITNTYMVIYNTLSELQIGYDLARADGLGVVAAAQWALNAAMDANPIGAIIAGVGVLVGLLSTAYGFWHGMFGSNRKVEIEHKLAFDTTDGQSSLNNFSENVSTAGNKAYDFANTMVSASRKVSNQMNSLTAGAVHIKGFTDKKVAEVQAYWQGGLEGILKRKAQEEQYEAALAHARASGFMPYSLMRFPTKSTMSTMPKNGGNHLLGMQGDFKGDSEPSSKATGSKVYNVNIKIGSIGNYMRVYAENTKEAGAKVHDYVVEQLESAIRNSQLVSQE